MSTQLANKIGFDKLMRLFAIVAAKINFLVIAIWSIYTANPERHWDGYQYFKAFNSSSLTEAYNYVGRYPEIFLQYTYFVLHDLAPGLNVTQIIIFNGLLAGFMVLAFHISVLLTFGKKISVLTVMISALATSPGIGLQISRQSISIFIICIVVIWLIKLRRSATLIILVTTALTHHGSVIVNFVNLCFFKNKLRLGTVTIIIGFIVILSISSYFELNYNEFVFSPEAPFSVLSYNVVLLVSLILMAIKKFYAFSNSHLFLLVIVCALLSIFPTFMVKRVFFGVELTIIPYLLGITASSISKNFVILITFLLFANVLKLFFIIWSLG